MSNKMLLASSIITMVSFSAFAQTHNDVAPVEAKGFHQTVLSNHSVQFDSTQNQMRALRFIVDPGGTLAAHQHTGPGFICVLNGQLSSTVAGSAIVAKAGECIFDPGNENHMLKNTTETYVSGLTFEVTPVSDGNKTSRMHMEDPGMESILPPK